MTTKPLEVALPDETQTVDTLIQFVHWVSELALTMNMNVPDVFFLAMKSRGVLLACERDGLVKLVRER